MLFSHPAAERAPSHTAVPQVAHEGLFREPEFAPETPRPTADEPAPIRRQHGVRAQSRRTTGRNRAA